MSGFNYEVGRSNNMVAAESRGMITIGRWAKRLGVSARAAVEVMQPSEAHHTGTGYRGRSRLTPVIAADAQPTGEQMASMRAWDAGKRPPVQGWYTRWVSKKPHLGVYRGDPAGAPKGMAALSDADFAQAEPLAGKRLAAFARRFNELHISESPAAAVENPPVKPIVARPAVEAPTSDRGIVAARFAALCAMRSRDVSRLLFAIR